MHHNTSNYDQRHAAQMAVIERLFGDPWPWHASLTHRQWFRDGDVREPMTDAEAAVFDAVYEARARKETSR